MKIWKFKVTSNPKVLSQKFEASLGSVDGFVFDLNNEEHDSFTFKMRKRVLYAWQMVFLNYVVVKGRVLSTEAKNETDVEISFAQHFLMTLIILIYIVGALCWLILIISGIGNSPAVFIVGGIPVAVSIIFWFDARKRFERKVDEYKTLISGILEL